MAVCTLQVPAGIYFYYCAVRVKVYLVFSIGILSSDNYSQMRDIRVVRGA